MDQKSIYDSAYRGEQRLRRLLRFDIRYRRRRVADHLATSGLDARRWRVLDVGFGMGDLLLAFPAGCSVHGTEISASAVAQARRSQRFDHFSEASFSLVPEHDPSALPEGPFDAVLCSHVLEHVDDDQRWLEALAERTRIEGGYLVLFVPLESHGYNPDHVRAYTLESFVARVRSAGLEVVIAEGSLHLNGHVWKWLTIPSRRRWPVLGPLVNTCRMLSQALIPYRLTRWLERVLDQQGWEPRQAFVLARRAAPQVCAFNGRSAPPQSVEPSEKERRPEWRGVHSGRRRSTVARAEGDGPGAVR